MIQVAAVLICDERGRLLLCRRGPGGNCAGLWEFPGGKFEPGETAGQCAVRECREELAVEVTLEGKVARTRYDYPDKSIDFTFFKGHIAKGEPRPLVHQELQWAATNCVGRYNLCPADRAMWRQYGQQFTTDLAMK